ncbi:hypothetical protein AALP_AA7G211300 [Arabis alpina]|uniref:Uncharacterized protein n=1 Tax=Arabis alpina TaxID=50452 RepID=A0A087GJK5_ARAAL|nr:hypothetical protein AALP_AA7G211300 [Arabis alpina]
MPRLKKPLHLSRQSPLAFEETSVALGRNLTWLETIWFDYSTTISVYVTTFSSSSSSSLSFISLSFLSN